MSMAASIESRVPFLDHVLVEHVLAMPAASSCAAGRPRPCSGRRWPGLVPQPILTRRKMGFPVPVGRWLRGPFWPVVEEFVLSPRAAAPGHVRPARPAPAGRGAPSGARGTTATACGSS